MKTLLATIALALGLSAYAATVPLYISGNANTAYAVSATATVTATNTSITYTNLTFGVTNMPEGDETLYVSWRGVEKTYTFATNPATATQITIAANTTNQLFNIMDKLQGDFPSVRVGEYNKQTITIAAPTTDSLVVTNSAGYFTTVWSSYYDTTNASQSVTLSANPVTLVTNTIVYVSAVSLNTNTLVLTVTKGTNTFVTSQ